MPKDVGRARDAQSLRLPVRAGSKGVKIKMLKISALALVSPPRVRGRRSVVSFAAENKHRNVGQARATTTS